MKIENTTQLNGTLAYMEKLANALEGRRRHSLETENSLFAVTAEGFLTHLRENLADVRAYVTTQNHVVTPHDSGANGIGANGPLSSRLTETAA